ncbi:hypothetical protein [uncultured Gammaproteobacteria bacterium]|nr:hypothetical protein [uncultured Gammaproteobacteria bacterium]
MVNIPFDRLIECCTYDVNSRVLDYECPNPKIEPKNPKNNFHT